MEVSFSAQLQAQETTTSAVSTPPVAQRRPVDDYFGESLNGMGFGLFDEVGTVHGRFDDNHHPTALHHPQ